MIEEEKEGFEAGIEILKQQIEHLGEMDHAEIKSYLKRSRNCMELKLEVASEFVKVMETVAPCPDAKHIVEEAWQENVKYSDWLATVTPEDLKATRDEMVAKLKVDLGQMEDDYKAFQKLTEGDPQALKEYFAKQMADDDSGPAIRRPYPYSLLDL
jgi:hypothetical protein